MRIDFSNLAAKPTIEGALERGKATKATTDPIPEQGKAEPNRLREDFKSELEKHMTNRLRTAPESIRSAISNDEGKFDIGRLPEAAQKELTKLQSAAEGFESYFIKDLLSKMRPASLTDEPSSMTNFAKDMMDQAIADSTSKGGASIGIAKTVFISMGEQIAKQGIGTAIISAQQQGK